MCATGQRLVVLLIAVLLTTCLLAAPAAAQEVRVDQLEIDVSEIEAAQGQYKPIPTPEPGHPARMLLDSQRVDLTGTLPEAVLESMLGASPMDFVDAVWEMEVTGGWTDHLTGEGTLQVFNFTEGMGASARPDPDRFTGAMGMSTYAAVLDTPHGHEFRLSAAFPADAGGVTPDTEPDSNFNSPKSALFVVGCHMFEPGHTGCIQTPRPPPEYYTTEQPILEKTHITVRGDSTYRILFSARVEETRHYVENTRYINGRPHHDWREEPSGRVGHVEGWVCDRTSWEADPETCIPQHEPLRVVENTPEHERENVNFLTPAVEWEFNVPVDRDSLQRAFSLTTRDAGNDPIEVSGDIVGGNGVRFTFKPGDDLESGVIYEARLRGGEDGVRTRDGSQHLASDHWWRFSTILDFERQNEPDGDPLQVRIYQTVRNAPLVNDKPAVIRLYPHWEAHEHIHSAWQPTSFPFNLELNVVSEAQRRVETQFGGAQAGDAIRIHRPDQFNDEHRRLAQHTLNIYGWSPTRQTGSTPFVEVGLAAHDPYPVPPDPAEWIVEEGYEIWQTDPRPLVIRYGFLNVGPWADGVPDSDRQIAAAVVREAAEFAQQILPVRQARAVYTGVEESRPGRFIAPAKRLLGAMRQGAAASAHDDVFVVFYPANSIVCSEDKEGKPIRCGGAAFDAHSSADPERGLMLAIAGTVDGVTIPVSLQAESLVHELGHHLGLTHRPGDADSKLIDSGIAGQGLYSKFTPLGYTDPDIDGFRIATDGMAGWNKSAEEGNAQHPSTLAPLMWPSPVSMESVWITDAEYRRLMDAIAPWSGTMP